MQKRVSKTSLVRRAGALAVAGAATAALAGLGAGIAQADPDDNLDQDCLQFSQDGGATWGGHGVIQWREGTRPIPGNEALYGDFDVRNKCDAPAKLEVYAGRWSVADGGSANVRADAGTARGKLTRLQGDPGILLVETNRLERNKAIPVKLYIGLPADETQQNFDISPDFGMALVEVEPDAPVDPGPGGGGNGGGSGSSGSSTGSLGDIFGSLGGSLGSLSGKSAAQSLNAPAVTAGR